MVFPTTLRAVLFDLDGTLVDTADEFVPVVQALRAEHGLPAMEPRRIRASVSNGARALVALALDMDESDSAFEQQRQRLLELYRGVLGSRARLYPGIGDLLQALQRAGRAWGISTNKPRPLTEVLLLRLDIRPAAGSVVCPDDISERKPHPETLLRNCRELGCAPAEAIYIGDHRRDIEAGRRAGMYTIAAAWGYIEDGDDPDNWGADARVDNSEDLLQFIHNRTQDDGPGQKMARERAR